jgi:hypothetical protein
MKEEKTEECPDYEDLRRACALIKMKEEENDDEFKNRTLNRYMARLGNYDEPIRHIGH